MTENKQFIIPDYPDCIKDTKNDKEYPMSSYYPHIEGICELLNNLSDETEELKKIISTLKDIIYRDEMALIWEYSTNMDDEEELEAAYDSEDITELIKFCKR